MNTKDKFIGIYEDAFSSVFCKKVIDHFDDMQKNGFTKNRQEINNGHLKIEKEDDSLFLHSMEELNLYSGNFLEEFNDIFWKKYNIYANEFSVLNMFPKHNNYSFKVQKTKIGGGYHIWHCETSSKESCHRILAWTLYLNDVEEGGETEFLYQNMRVKPKQGTLVIWPAGFTHVHRGNPPLSNQKYIVTGWVEF